jgi:hypothetical protein
VLPADFSLAADQGENGSGSITWRGLALPLHALGQAPTRMLVIRHEEKVLGLLVDAVETLLPASLPACPVPSAWPASRSA